MESYVALLCVARGISIHCTIVQHPSSNNYIDRGRFFLWVSMETETLYLTSAVDLEMRAKPSSEGHLASRLGDWRIITISLN